MNTKFLSKKVCYFGYDPYNSHTAFVLDFCREAGFLPDYPFHAEFTAPTGAT